MKKNNSSLIYAIMGCVLIFLLVYVARNSIYPKEIVSVCRFLFTYVMGLMDILALSDTAYSIFTGYETIFKIAMMALHFVIGIAVIKFLPSKIAKGSACIYSSAATVIRYGLSYFGLSAILIILLLNSVVGIAAAVMIFLFTVLICFIGSIFFMVAMGSWLQDAYNGNMRSLTVNFLIGFLAVNICCNIYGFAGPAVFFIFPVLFTGSFFWMAQNFITRGYFDTSSVGYIKEGFDRNKIRDIITKDVM